MANPFSVSVTPAATLVYSPQTTTDHVFISNNGPTTVYLGQAGVTAFTGLPLAPRQLVDLSVITKPIYAASEAGGIGGLSGTATALLAKAGTGITVASGGASWTQGMLLQINDGPATEVVVVGAGSGATNIVIGAAAFAHNTGFTFQQYLGGAGGTLTVTPGAR